MGTENQRRLVLIVLLLLAPLCRAESAMDLPVRVLEQALAGEDLKPLFGLIDGARLADRAGLDRGTAAALERIRHRIGKQTFADYRLYTGRDGRLLLRLDLTPRGLNWLVPEWHATTGDTPLTDWYDAALGISLSELVAGMAMLAESGAGRDFLKTLDESPRRAWNQLSRDQQRQNPAAARLLLAACGGNACYSTALQAVERLPQPSAALWQLDAAALANDREAFRDTLDELEARFGPDPGLAWLAGAEALRYGGCESVMNRINQAVGEWPDYQPLYPVLTQCLVTAGNHGMALNFIGIMEDRFGLQFDWQAMAEHPVYAELVRSEAFDEWRRARQQAED